MWVLINFAALILRSALAVFLRVLNDSLLPMNFSLFVGHSDPLGHRVLSRWQDGPTGSVISQQLSAKVAPSYLAVGLTMF